MYQQQFYIIANFLMVVDALIIIATGYVAYSVSLETTGDALVMGWYDFLGCVLFLMFSNNYFMGRRGFYSAKRFPSKWPMLGSLFIAVSLGFIVLSAGVILLGVKPFSRVYLVVHFCGALLALAATRIMLYYYLDNRAKTAFNSRQILIMGDTQRVCAVADALEKQPSWGHEVAGCLCEQKIDQAKHCSVPLLGTPNNFDRIVRERQIDEVIFALPKDSPLRLDEYLEKCKNIGVAVRIVPAMFDPSDPTLRVEAIQGIPTLTDYAAFRSASGLLYKKVLDLAAGCIGFVLFLLMYPIIGLAIKLDSPGPVLFRQIRMGMHGREFTLYKFRSMVWDADAKKKALLKKSEMNGPIFKMEDDPRITTSVRQL